MVVVGATSSEGADRPDAQLPAHQRAYLQAVAAAGSSKPVVVVMAPGAVVMDWAVNASAVVCFFMPGQAQGSAVASVLFGDVNPSGKLPVTMPARDNQVGFTGDQYPGAAFKSGLETNYSEKLEVGYRWHVAHRGSDSAQPSFSFGTGLSYTTFRYTSATRTRDALQLPPTLARDALQTPPTVSVTVTNTGMVPLFFCKHGCGPC